MDLLILELRVLSERMAEVSKLFSLILCPPNDVDECYIENYGQTLAAAYSEDLQRENLQEELRIFYKIHKDLNLCVDGHITSVLTLLNVSFQKGLENVLPQICICLRLQRVLPVLVASG
jgi:hypothetical protein